MMRAIFIFLLMWIFICSITVGVAIAQDNGNEMPIKIFINELGQDVLFSINVSSIVNFSSNVTTNIANITNWDYYWDFGDGENSADKDSSHIYNTSGNYTVSLTISNDTISNDTIEFNTSRTIIVNSIIDIEINPNPRNGTVPLTVNFSSSITGGISPYSYSWDFGDGHYNQSKNHSHTYYDYEEYNVTLTVTDKFGAFENEIITITVNPHISVDISADNYSGIKPFTVNFSSSVSGGTPPNSSSWDFGDGNTSTSSNPTNTYSSSGTYTARLTVTDSDYDSDSDSKNITVYDPLSVSISASPTSGFTPLTFNFTSTVTGCAIPYSYYWDFGDGFTSDSSNPTHTYGSSGTYSVLLKVDSEGYHETASITIDASIYIIAVIIGSVIFLTFIVVLIYSLKARRKNIVIIAPPPALKKQKQVDEEEDSVEYEMQLLDDWNLYGKKGDD